MAQGGTVEGGRGEVSVSAKTLVAHEKTAMSEPQGGFGEGEGDGARTRNLRIDSPVL